MKDSFAQLLDFYAAAKNEVENAADHLNIWALQPSCIKNLRINRRRKKMYDIKCTVKSIKGECPAGLKVGDYFYQKNMGWIEPGEPNGICLHALVAMAPYLTAKCRQVAPEDWIHDVQELQCPDSTNSVVFRLERMKEQ